MKALVKEVHADGSLTVVLGKYDKNNPQKYDLTSLEKVLQSPEVQNCLQRGGILGEFGSPRLDHIPSVTGRVYRAMEIREYKAAVIVTSIRVHRRRRGIFKRSLDIIGTIRPTGPLAGELTEALQKEDSGLRFGMRALVKESPKTFWHGQTRQVTNIICWDVISDRDAMCPPAPTTTLLERLKKRFLSK